MQLHLASKCFYLCPVNTRVPTIYLTPTITRDLFTQILTKVWGEQIHVNWSFDLTSCLLWDHEIWTKNKTFLSAYNVVYLVHSDVSCSESRFDNIKSNISASTICKKTKKQKNKSNINLDTFHFSFFCKIIQQQIVHQDDFCLQWY